jgi:PAS domain S-box-containing protein
VGQPALVFYPSSEACDALRRQARSQLGSGQVVDLETQLTRRDGSTFIAQLIARAIDPAEPGQATVWIVRDITQEVHTARPTLACCASSNSFSRMPRPAS